MEKIILGDKVIFRRSYSIIVAQNWTLFQVRAKTISSVLQFLSSNFLKFGFLSFNFSEKWDAIAEFCWCRKKEKGLISIIPEFRELKKKLWYFGKRVKSADSGARVYSPVTLKMAELSENSRNFDARLRFALLASLRSAIFCKI